MPGGENRTGAWEEVGNLYPCSAVLLRDSLSSLLPSLPPPSSL